jgi:hypothetical protein
MTIVEAPIKGQAAQSPSLGPGNLPTGRKVAYGLLAVLVVAVVVAVPVTVTQFTVHRRSTRGTSQVGTSSSSSSGSVLSQEYCDKLSGAAKDYCGAYVKSKGPSKFMAASIWLQVSQATRKLHYGCAPSHMRHVMALDYAVCTAQLACMRRILHGWSRSQPSGFTPVTYTRAGCWSVDVTHQQNYISTKPCLHHSVACVVHHALTCAPVCAVCLCLLQMCVLASM